MTNVDATDRPDLSPGVALLAVNMHDVEFHFHGGVAQPDAQAPVQFQMKLIRPSKTDIIVELGIEITGAAVFSSKIVYRARFRRTGEPGTQAEQDEYWRLVCAQLAPIVIYPYARETLSSMAAKAGLPAVVLPVLNVGSVINPSTIILPPEPSGDEESE